MKLKIIVKIFLSVFLFLTVSCSSFVIMNVAAAEFSVLFCPEDEDDFSACNLVSVEEGSLLPADVAAPAKPGYRFVGWSTGVDADDNPIFWNFATDVMPGYNITLWATYEQSTFRVYFDPVNDTPMGEWEMIEVEEGQLIPEPATVAFKEGYKFVGWAQAFVGDTPIFWDFATDVMPGNNITLWAAYEPDTGTKEVESSDNNKVLPNAGQSGFEVVIGGISAILVAGVLLLKRKND